MEHCERLVGQKIARTDWIDIDQMQVNILGEITRWPTWMHNDRDRAARESPYGGTIIHGFFMVSLLTFFSEAGGLRPADGKFSLNYGLDKVRVLRPAVIGEGVRLRDQITLLDVTEKSTGEYLMKSAHVIEQDGYDKPALYAEYLNYWFAE